MTQILKNARRREIFQVMNRGDVRELAQNLTGKSLQDTEVKLKESGRCLYCVDLIDSYFKTHQNRPILYFVFEKERKVVEIND